MIMTEYYSSTNYNKFDNFTVTDNFGNTYLFVRSLGKKKGFFNIVKCEVLAKDRCVPKGYAGIIPDATWFSDEEVADLVGQHEEYQERLAKTESSLKQWIDFSKEWKKIPKRKRSLQKQEVV